MYTERMRLCVNDEEGRRRTAPGRRAGPEVAEGWWGEGSLLRSLRARLPVGAVARTMEVLVRLHCTHALCEPKDKDKEWLPGGMRGPRGGSRPLSPCLLPASGICPQALVELCGHRTASTSPPPGFFTVLGLHWFSPLTPT